MKSNWNPEMFKAFEMIIKIDHTFKKVYDQIGPPKNRTMKKGFQSLAKIIIGQQISTNIADTIYNKLMIDDILNEDRLLSLSVNDLKKYGLSSQKSFYLKNLAELIHKKRVKFKHPEQTIK
jgi:DNA-3-methyladenine glycosylase II